MGNPFLWAQACRIDNTLQGEDWPKRMTPIQIAKLHFHTDENLRKILLALLNKKADCGAIEFDEITESYSWHGSSVSVGYATQPSQFSASIRDMHRKSRDKHLSEDHRPACGWAKLLQGNAPGESLKLADHACNCEALCTVEKVYPNGLPKRWRVEGIHPDGFSILFSCFAEPLISAQQYLDFCSQNGIPVIPNDSPLIGWEPQAIQPPLTEEENDRQTVQAIARQWLKQFPLSQYLLLTTRAAKNHPKLGDFYEKYPGHDPIKPDEWLVEAGIPRGKTGRKSKAETEFILLFLKS